MSRVKGLTLHQGHCKAKGRTDLEEKGEGSDLFPKARPGCCGEKRELRPSLGGWWQKWIHIESGDVLWRKSQQDSLKGRKR